MNSKEQLRAFMDYLLDCGFQQESLASYHYTVAALLKSYPEADKFSYRDIIHYLDELNSQGCRAENRQSRLVCLKKYYDYLLDTGLRKDHPCKHIHVKVKGRQRIIHEDLFTLSELESLLEREAYFSFHENRNRIILSLLVYQALMPGEIIRLRLKDIDLDQSQVHIAGKSLLKERQLPLLPVQVEWLDMYLHSDRPAFLAQGIRSDFLILCNKRRAAYTSDSIGYLLETLKPRFPGRNLTAKAIRDSVISHWLNDKKIPLEQVQMLAGHRWVCSTQRYTRNDHKTQRELLNRFFASV